MPTYEYLCTGCESHFEFFQYITEPAKDTCPQCGKPLKRLISSGAGIIFKGRGFYATDYRKKEDKKTTATTNVSNEQIDKKENKD
ncbi:MAG: zinc ribbon domain-containing protein [Candidatus Omnitrophica bacterium]|nr:zinc ribbon domain-containing protein [Candidatus Omnitrophota bacterium]